MVSGKDVGLVLIGIGSGFATKYAYDKFLGGAYPHLTLEPSTVKYGQTFRSTISGFKPRTIIYGIAYSPTGGPPTIFTVGTTNEIGQLAVEGQVTLTTGRWPMIVFSEDGTAAVAFLTIT